MFVIFLVTFLAPSLRAQKEEGGLDGNGLVCRRDDTYFSRPYYFTFENKKALGPWVTNDTPAILRNILESNYNSTSSIVYWGRYILIRQSLKLISHLDTPQEKVYRCEIMEPQHMNKVVQEKNEKLQNDPVQQH